MKASYFYCFLLLNSESRPWYLNTGVFLSHLIILQIRVHHFNSLTPRRLYSPLIGSNKFHIN